MGLFLRSKSIKSDKRNVVVVTVVLPKDEKVKEKVLTPVAQVAQHINMMGTDEGKLLLKETTFSFTRSGEVNKETTSDDNNTLSTDPNSRASSFCGSISSKDMESIHDSLNESDFEELLESGSADSSISSSTSSLSADGRDDKQVTVINIKQVDKDSSAKSEECQDKQINQNENSVKPPISPISFTNQSLSSIKSEDKPIITCNTCTTTTKPQTIRELRRSASNGSKNYVHVFHNQLTTLKEQPSKEDYDDDDYSTSIGQHPSFTLSFDEHEIRQRWDYTKKIMTKLKSSEIQQ